MPKRVRANRPIERAAVNAAQAFFEKHNLIFGVVDLVNDVGKDAHVDITFDNEVSGLCFAVQCKGGAQTLRRRATTRTRGIPYTAEDAEFFAATNIPVIGIAHMEEDPQLYWVDLTAHCKAQRALGRYGGSFAPATGVLTDDTFDEFIDYTVGRLKNSPEAVALELVSENPKQRSAAISDCVALSRDDFRPLLLVRRLLPYWDSSCVLDAAVALSFSVWVPDRAGGTHLLGREIKDRVAKELSWSINELELLLTCVDDPADLFGRGVIGQCVSAILLADSSLSSKLFNGVRSDVFSRDGRARALFYIVYQSDDDDAARDILARLGRLNPDILRDDLCRPLYDHVMEWGIVNVFDD